MHTLKSGFLLAVLSLLTAAPGSVAGPAQEAEKQNLRVLLVPLDDRPVCLQLPLLLGPIANADIITPPRSLLGRFTTGGDSAAIASWLKKQEGIDAVIVSIDMLAYGGLVASRVHEVSEADALARLGVIEEIRSLHPDIPIYGFSIIMRLAPTADGANEAWRVALSRWAELVSEAESDADAAKETKQLEKRIPAEVLANYQEARARNLAVNRAAIEMVKNEALDYLILGQDDAKPKGIHVADRRELLKLIEEYDLANQVTVQPGADEVAMLLLARVLTNRLDYHPSIKPIFSSETIRTMFAPYEDRPLHETVSHHIAAAGGRETTEEDADLLFYVFGSRHEPDAAEPFAERIASDIRAGRKVIVADVDTRGDVQGSAVQFTEALRQHKVFPHLFGYASWNTAGNTIGTALPQGILYALATDPRMEVDQSKQKGVQEAQITFLLQRLINDYLYHSLIRPEINRNYLRERGMNPMRLSSDESREVEEAILNRVRPLAEEIWQDFLTSPKVGNSLGNLSKLELTLPWERTFEAEIKFSISRKSAMLLKQRGD